MELLDRYLQAVRKHLPAKRQDDIIAELRANLESQIEDKEAEMSRTLTMGEIEAILKKMGPPMLVAGRYLPQQYLIGPGLFPVYWYVLRMALTWAAVIYIVVSAIQIALAAQDSPLILEAVLRVPSVLFLTAAWVTAAFAAFEYAGALGLITFPGLSYLQTEWSPGSLPPLERTQGEGKPRTYVQAAAEVIFGLLSILWLLLVPHHPWVMFGPGAAFFAASPLKLTAVWWTFYWWAIAFSTAQLTWRGAALWRGTWRFPHPLEKIVMDIFGLVPLFILIAAPGRRYIELKNAVSGPILVHGALIDVGQFNYWTYRVILLIVTISTLQLLWEIVQMGIAKWRERAAR